MRGLKSCSGNRIFLAGFSFEQKYIDSASVGTALSLVVLGVVVGLRAHICEFQGIAKQCSMLTLDTRGVRCIVWVLGHWFLLGHWFPVRHHEF